MLENHLEGLIQQALHVKLIDPLDEIYVRNRIYALLKREPVKLKNTFTKETIPNLLEKIIEEVVAQNIIEDVLDEKEMFSAELMNCFIARPSVINAIFHEKFKVDPKDATDYFYTLSKNSNYIQMNRIQKNSHFKANTGYGSMDITINLSKPEKDPEQIKREKDMKRDIDYPACLLCIENEGYQGRIGFAARANHRIIQISLENEQWYLQYSPYVYYPEHSILLSKTHRDMKIDKQTFKVLLAFIEQFPHYFIGSNADLPIVGGSILSHDHYQAGNYTFTMDHAKTKFQFTLPNFPEVIAYALDWPLATVRLQCQNKEMLVAAANSVFEHWQKYEDIEAEIIPFTNGTPHNTVTPIARMNGKFFELDLVLRNNRTSDEHPLGIFHPHADVHHIKKENIGLIEVMGLAVLPARLKNELEEIKKCLLKETNTIASYHLDWANELCKKYPLVTTEQEATEIIQNEVGKKFAKALDDAGVFKNDTAWTRFLTDMNVKVGV